MSFLPPADVANLRELRTRLGRAEDQWAERKASQKGDEREIRRTLVGFANSVRDGEWAVLYLGAANDGKHPGVLDADDLQRRVRQIVDTQCYPPFEFRPVQFAVQADGNEVTILAIQVPASEKRPHFSGRAFVREGSETRDASEEQMNELIASRNDKARWLQKIKMPLPVRVRSVRGFYFEYSGVINHPLDAHAVVIRDDSGGSRSVPLRDVEIISSISANPVIQIPPIGTELEHISGMLRRWRLQRGIMGIPTPNLKDDTLRQLFPFSAEVLPLMAQLGWRHEPQGSLERLTYDLFFAKARAPLGS